MIIASIDIEATGLEETSEIVELGLVVMETTNRMIMAMHSDLYKTEGWSDEAEAIHRIDRTSADQGLITSDPWELIAHYNPVAMVAHNAEYDKRLAIRRWPKFGQIPWICTHRDLPHERFINKVSSNRLQHLAVDYGFDAGRRHRALFDALLCCEIAAMHDLESILKTVNEPRFSIMAWFEGRPDFNDKDFQLQKEYLKKAGFKWDGDNWIKSNVVESVTQKYIALATVKPHWKTRVVSVDKQN
jgi:DNA polymerase III epsilon subunit-like protein